MAGRDLLEWPFDQLNLLQDFLRRGTKKEVVVNLVCAVRLNAVAVSPVGRVSVTVTVPLVDPACFS